MHIAPFSLTPPLLPPSFHTPSQFHSPFPFSWKSGASTMVQGLALEEEQLNPAILFSTLSPSQYMLYPVGEDTCNSTPTPGDKKPPSPPIPNVEPKSPDPPFPLHHTFTFDAPPVLHTNNIPDPNPNPSSGNPTSFFTHHHHHRLGWNPLRSNSMPREHIALGGPWNASRFNSLSPSSSRSPYVDAITSAPSSISEINAPTPSTAVLGLSLQARKHPLLSFVGSMQERQGWRYDPRRRRTYQCPTCQKVFTNGQAFGGHFASHTKSARARARADASSPATKREGKRRRPEATGKTHDTSIVSAQREG